MPIDVSTFKPETVQDFFKGLLAVVKDTAAGLWEQIKDEITYQMKFIAERTARVSAMLVAGQIDEKEADATLHLLEINLNSALRQITFMAYATAQKVLSAVFNLLRNAIRNITGFDLLF